MKEYLLWIGYTQCTTGTPNKRTGLHSKFGQYHKFTSAQDRDKFIDSHNLGSQQSAIKGTRNTLRPYARGWTMEEYHEYLDMLEYYVPRETL